MYGFIHCALADLVLAKFGEETWREIVKAAGVELGGGSYLIHKIYSDDETLSLVGAAVEILGIGLNDVLEVFGAHFLEYCIKSEYDQILRVLGGNLRDFLCNLDALHDHLATIYDGMEAPSFRCTESADGTLFLHYYSGRPGLSYIVVGLVKALAEKMLHTTVDVKIHKDISDDHDHVIFAIRECVKCECEGECKCTSNKSSKLGLQDLGSSSSLKHRSVEFKDNRMTLASFCKAFPFHVMFDRDLVIQQAGIALMRTFNVQPKGRLKFSALFELSRPRMDVSFATFLSHINTVFVTKIRPSFLASQGKTPPKSPQKRKLSRSESEDPSTGLQFKGQMVHVPESDCILFICSPRVRDMSRFKDYGLHLSDIPVHDATRDLILMSQASNADRELVEKLEETSNDLRKMETKLIEKKKRTDELLHSILPQDVVAKLRLNEPVPAETHNLVTILFSDIVGFTALCSSPTVEPMDIVRLLDELYTEFDRLSVENDVYKVETIGDAYMVVGGLPTPCDNHAEKVAHMGCSMMEAGQKVLSPVDGLPIKMRIGIHSGPVMAGVVGTKMPRYCLFGKTVTLANKMESGSKPGFINVSCETKRYLKYSTDFEFSDNTEIPNPLTCHFLERKQKRLFATPSGKWIFTTPVESRRRSDSGPQEVSRGGRDYTRRPSAVDVPPACQRPRFMFERRPSALPAICTVGWPNGVVPARKRVVSRGAGERRNEAPENGTSDLVFDVTDVDDYITDPEKISQVVDRLQLSTMNGTRQNSKKRNNNNNNNSSSGTKHGKNDVPK